MAFSPEVVDALENGDPVYAMDWPEGAGTLRYDLPNWRHFAMSYANVQRDELRALQRRAWANRPPMPITELVRRAMIRTQRKMDELFWKGVEQDFAGDTIRAAACVSGGE